jgi:hypothetical protein
MGKARAAAAATPPSAFDAERREWVTGLSPMLTGFVSCLAGSMAGCVVRCGVEPHAAQQIPEQLING